MTEVPTIWILGPQFFSIKHIVRVLTHGVSYCVALVQGAAWHLVAEYLQHIAWLGLLHLPLKQETKAFYHRTFTLDRHWPDSTSFLFAQTPCVLCPQVKCLQSAMTVIDTPALGIQLSPLLSLGSWPHLMTHSRDWNTFKVACSTHSDGRGLCYRGMVMVGVYATGGWWW